MAEKIDKTAVFIGSAVEPKDFPPPDRLEVAFVGRSNAGKSSLINSFFGKKMARVSNTPGKTRLINFFNIGRYYRLVDLPGYGYASRSGDEMRTWRKMIETYLKSRKNIEAIVLVMDVRRDFEDDEFLMSEFCEKIQKPLIIVMTKVDKLNNTEKSNRVKSLKDQSGLEHFFLVSSTENTGIKELEEFIFNFIIKPKVINK